MPQALSARDLERLDTAFHGSDHQPRADIRVFDGLASDLREFGALPIQAPGPYPKVRMPTFPDGLAGRGVQGLGPVLGGHYQLSVLKRQSALSGRRSSPKL